MRLEFLNDNPYIIVESWESPARMIVGYNHMTIMTKDIISDDELENVFISIAIKIYPSLYFEKFILQ